MCAHAGLIDSEETYRATENTSVEVSAALRLRWFEAVRTILFRPPIILVVQPYVFLPLGKQETGFINVF